MKNTLLLLSFILFSTFLFSQTKEGKTPIITIKAPYNQSIIVENLTIKLIDVLEDSRCPTGTTCVWAGRAKMLIEVTEEGQDPIQKELILGKKLPGEYTGDSIFFNEAFTIKVVGLTPYPSVENKIEKESYTLLLVVN